MRVGDLVRFKRAVLHTVLAKLYIVSSVSGKTCQLLGIPGAFYSNDVLEVVSESR